LDVDLLNLALELEHFVNVLQFERLIKNLLVQCILTAYCV